MIHTTSYKCKTTAELEFDGARKCQNGFIYGPENRHNGESNYINNCRKSVL